MVGTFALFQKEISKLTKEKVITPIDLIFKYRKTYAIIQKLEDILRSQL